MATTFSVTQTPSTTTDATWASTSAYTWASTFANNVWAAVRDPVAYDAQVGETITGADSIGNVTAFVRNLPEAFALVESSVRNPTLKPNETIAIAEAYSDVVAFSRNIPEVLAFLESAAKAAGINKAESFALAEAYNDVAAFSRAINEALALAETQNNAPNVVSLETLGVADSYSDVATFNRNITETVALAESIAKLFNTYQAGSLALSDASANTATFSRNLAETLAASDDNYFDMEQGLNDVWAMSDGQSFDAEKGIDEVIGTTARALSLASASAGAVIPNSPSLQVTGDLTIEMWLYPTAFGARRNPIAKAYGGEYTVTQETNGTLNFYWGTAGGNTSPYQGFGSPAVTKDKWNYVVLRRKLGAGGFLKWNVNVINITSTAPSYAAAVASSLGVTIGSGYAGIYEGMIDDVRIYNRAISDQEVSEHNQGIFLDDTGLVASWSFDEESGATFLDKSGNGNHGTMPASVNRSELVRNQIARNKNDATSMQAETASIADSRVFGIGRNVSEMVTFVEQMTRVAGFTKAIDEVIFVLGASLTWEDATFTWAAAEALASWNDPKGFKKQIGKNASETLAIAEVNSRDAVFARAIAETIAVAEAITKNQTTAQYETLAVAEAFDDLLVQMLLLAESIGISESVGKAPSLQYAEGFAISDIMTRNVAFLRSLDEAIALLEQRSSDVSVQYNEALLVASARKMAAFGQSGNSKVTVANSTSLQTPHTLSVEFWCQGDHILSPSWARLAGKATEGTDSNGWMIYRNTTTDRVGIRLDSYIGTNVYNQNRAEITGTLDGKLHHIVFTLNSGVVKSYKDGALANSGTYVHSAIGFNTTNPLYVGANTNIGINGLMGGFRIYDHELTADEVAAHYHGDYSNETGLLIHLPLQSDANDVSGNNNNGTLTGTVLWADADIVKTPGINKSESAAIAEARRSDAAPAFQESVAISDSDKKDAVTSQSEVLSLTDSYDKAATFARNIAEALATLDGVSNGSAINKSESVQVVDAIADQVDFVRAFSETVTTLEAFSKAYGLAKSESVALAESNAKLSSKAIAETLAAVDALSNAAGITKGETLAVADGVSKNATKALSELLATLDAIQSSANKGIAEAIALAEALGRVAAYNKALAEGITLSDALARSATLSASEALAISDELRRNAQAVISDILIGSTDITPAEFDTLLAQAQAPGYGPFVQFTEGDHEYKNAIFKAIIQASTVSSGRLSDLEVSVDVPDQFDTGTVVIANTGTTVTFNKVFFTPPEVNASIKGGTVFAIPRIRNITKDGFVIELFDASNNMVAGTATWAAHGY